MLWYTSNIRQNMLKLDEIRETKQSMQETNHREIEHNAQMVICNRIMYETGSPLTYTCLTVLRESWTWIGNNTHRYDECIETSNINGQKFTPSLSGGLISSPFNQLRR